MYPDIKPVQRRLRYNMYNKWKGNLLSTPSLNHTSQDRNFHDAAELFLSNALHEDPILASNSQFTEVSPYSNPCS